MCSVALSLKKSLTQRKNNCLAFKKSKGDKNQNMNGIGQLLKYPLATKRFNGRMIPA